MSKLWLLGVLAAVLAVGLVGISYAQDNGPPTGKHPGPNAGGPKGDQPEVVLTPEQQEKLQPSLDAFTDALTKHQDKATKVLGDKDGAQFVRQTIFAAMRPAGKGEGKAKGGHKLDAPPEGPKGEAGVKGAKQDGPAGREKPPEIVLTPEQKEQLQPSIDALTDAIAELRHNATKVLGDNAKPFLMQTIMKALRPAGKEGKVRKAQ